MFQRFSVLGIVLAALVLLNAGQCRGDEASERGRAIYKANRHSVVTVEIAIQSKISLAGVPAQTNLSRREVTGTVIQPSGLTVLSLTASDPSQTVQSAMGGDPRLKMVSELSEIKILMEDGAELDGELIWRDKDLDLAFIRPKSKLSKPMEALNLSRAGKADVLDQVIALNRLGNAVNRAYSASVERIAAIGQSPRLYYVPDANLTSTTLGAPAFTMDGSPLGLFVMRAVKSKPGNTGVLGGQNDTIAGIIVPAQDVLEAAKRVPAEPEKDAK